MQNGYFTDWSVMEGRETYPGDVVWPCTGDQLQVIRSHLTQGTNLPYHQHPQEQIITVLQGTLEYTVGEETQLVTAGHAIRVPSNVRHGGRVLPGDDAVCIEAFSPIRVDFDADDITVDLYNPS